MEEEEREKDTENAKGKLGRAGVSSEISVHKQGFFASSFSSTTMTGRNYFFEKVFLGFYFPARGASPPPPPPCGLGPWAFFEIYNPLFPG